jgi:hypothetical protein
MDRWLKFGRCCFFVGLQRYKPALPSPEDAAAYKQAYSAKYDNAQDVAFAVDGCKINIQAPTNELIQSQFYNGWTHGHYVSNVFVINAPGSFHDSTVSE